MQIKGILIIFCLIVFPGGVAAAKHTNYISSDLVPCELDNSEQCIQITLPCTEESTYGKAGWYDYPCRDEVIEIPNGRPVYAFLISGFDQNKNLDSFHFYNFARCIFRRTEHLGKKAYIHYAWWNNLLAPYMKKPLHNNESVPSKVRGALEAAADYAGFIYDPNTLTPGLVAGTYISGYPTKAVPAEDYQFQKDARTVLEAIRERNPDAAIVLVGHSMGGDAVIRLADSMPEGFRIDLLAPIDPVGNRTCLPNYPMTPAQMVSGNTTCDGAYNFTRFQATHDDWFWWPYRISYLDNDIRNLYHRWQNEAAFPFDWRCPLYTDVLGVHIRDAGCPLQLHMLSLPLDESVVPDAYMFRVSIDPGNTNVQSAVPMSWLSGTDVFPNPLYFWNWGGSSDGHGEIVGFRGLKPENILESYPLALAAQGTWPSRSRENCDKDAFIRPQDCERVLELKQWETDPEHLEENGWAPQKPPKQYCDDRNYAFDSDHCTYCMVSGDLCNILDTMIPDTTENLAPTADAGPDKIVECTSADGTGVTLDGSGSNDPDGDPITFTWTGLFGSMMGETIYVYLPAGTHTITLTVEDSSGNIDSDTVNVTVADSTPPSLSVSLSPNVLWPPNHKFVKITASVEVSDSCDGGPIVELVSITSNQADDDHIKGHGNKSDDIRGASFGTDDRAFSLRAERAGKGRGRIYSVTYGATDSSGNVASATAEVTVLHDRGSGHQKKLSYK